MSAAEDRGVGSTVGDSSIVAAIAAGTTVGGSTARSSRAVGRGDVRVAYYWRVGDGTPIQRADLCGLPSAGRAIDTGGISRCAVGRETVGYRLVERAH